MFLIFVAVAIILIFVNCLTFFFIKKLIAHINRQVKSYFVNQLQIFDEIASVKEEECRQVSQLTETIPQQETETIDKKEKIVYRSSKIKPARYTNLSFFEDYAKVTKAFQFDYQKIIEYFIEKSTKDRTTIEEYENIVEVLNIFSEKVKFSLYLVDGANQKEILENILDKKQQILLKDYMQDQIKFDLDDFISYLKYQLRLYDNHVYVEAENQKYLENSDAIFIENTNIHMGIKIIYKNKLYDYSL